MVVFLLLLLFAFAAPADDSDGPSAFEMGLYYAAHLDWFHRFLGGAASPWKPEDLVSGR